DRGRLLVRACGRAVVTGHERRLSAMRPVDRRWVGAIPVEHLTPVIEHAAGIFGNAAVVVRDVPGSRERHVGEKQDGCRAEQRLAAAHAVRARSASTVRSTCRFAVAHASNLGTAVLSARKWFSICRRYAAPRSIEGCACWSSRTSPSWRT